MEAKYAAHTANAVDIGEMSLEERLAYTLQLEKDSISMERMLRQMKNSEPQALVEEIGATTPSLPNMKIRNTNTLKTHKSKVLDMKVVNEGDGSGELGLASVSQDGMVLLWDARTGMKYEAFSTSRGHNLSIAVSPCGRLCTLGGLACTIDVFRIGDNLRQMLGSSVPPYTLQQTQSKDDTGAGTSAFWGVTGRLPNERSLQVPKGSRFRASAVRSQNYQTTLIGHDACVIQQAFVDEETLLSASTSGQLCLWNLPTCRKTNAFPACGISLNALQILRKAKGFLTGSDDGNVRLWDTRLEHACMISPGSRNMPVTAILCMPDGNTFLRSDSLGLSLIDLRMHGAIGIYDAAGEMPVCLATSPSGRIAIVGTDSGHCNVLDLVKNVWVGKIRGSKGTVTAIHAIGSKFYSSCSDGTIREWQLSC